MRTHFADDDTLKYIAKLEAEITLLKPASKLIVIPEVMEQAGWVRKKEWKGLGSDEEILELSKDAWGRDKLDTGRDDHTGFYIAFARAIEAKLKEENKK